MDTCNEFPCILITAAQDWNENVDTLSFIKEYIRPKKIVVISSDKIKDKVLVDDYINFIDEDKLYAGLTYENVAETLRKKGSDSKRAGWYLQQFLKMAYARICEDDYYLQFDYDTIPVRELKMFDEEGHPFFDRKPEYFEGYFEGVKNILGYDKKSKDSYIGEHMIFSSEIMKNMLNTIESNDSIEGKAFWEKIINAAPTDTTEEGFSEYETYGTYVEYNYPGVYVDRRIKSLRSGRIFLGDSPSREQLRWIGEKFDTISIERWCVIDNDAKKKASKHRFRKKHSINYLIKDTYVRLKYKAITEPTEENLNIYNKFQSCMQMDYFWCGSAWYKG